MGLTVENFEGIAIVHVKAFTVFTSRGQRSNVHFERLFPSGSKAALHAEIRFRSRVISTEL